MVSFVDEPLLQEHGATIWTVFGVFFRGFTTFLLAVVGALLSGTIASMAYPGWGAIVGASIGFAVIGLFSCFVVGFWRDVVPEEQFKTMHPGMLLPNAVIEKVGGGMNYSFDVAVTIHSIPNAQIRGYIVSSPQPYIEIVCGDEPRKSTCIKADFVWDEVFRIHVDRSVENINFTLMDQDMFGFTKIGVASVDVGADIIGGQFPFPKMKKIKIKQEDKDVLYKKKGFTATRDLRAGPDEDEDMCHLVLSFEKLDFMQETMVAKNGGYEGAGTDYDQENQLNHMYDKIYDPKYNSSKMYGSTMQQSRY